ncbi:MAG: hypothetical protein F6K41_20565 [Symploca sp. SIO3E6]|nr:hypothetical protein [Caldora sp. SIO3E6]
MKRDNKPQYCSVKRVWGVWGVWEVWEERKRGRGIRAYPSSIGVIYKLMIKQIEDSMARKNDESEA